MPREVTRQASGGRDVARRSGSRDAERQGSEGIGRQDVQRTSSGRQEGTSRQGSGGRKEWDRGGAARSGSVGRPTVRQSDSNGNSQKHPPPKPPRAPSSTISDPGLMESPTVAAHIRERLLDATGFSTQSGQIHPAPSPPQDMALVSNFKLQSVETADPSPRVQFSDSSLQALVPKKTESDGTLHHVTTGPGESSWYWSKAAVSSGKFTDLMLHFIQARKLEVENVGGVHKADGSVIKGGKGEDGVPVRKVNRSSRLVAGVLVLVIIGITGQSFYAMVPMLIRNHATWEWVSLFAIGLGMFFFTFALKMALSALLSPFCGSIKALEYNSEFYSAVPTPVKPGSELPPVVIQIPVYKEDLNDVIIPTLRSVGRAMEHYNRRGGVVKLMICDDGLQLLEDEVFLERLNFYRKNQISFVARPAGNRRGLFKKASNLNYGLRVSDQVAALQKDQGTAPGQALMEVWQRMEYKFLAGGDLAIPDDALILLLDADTRVPENCIAVTIGEFMAYPELPYTQHFTAPFDEQNRNYWEQLISDFTRKIYGAGIAVGASTGDYAPLVGHNAFLRYSAMKSVAFYCPEEKFLKYWSETTVSEDFDLFIRFATKNMFGRYVMYTGDGFQEGVSLTYIDEVIKLRKFTFGACEMCFRPFSGWWRGPFAPILLKFMGSRLPWYWKVGLMTYLGSYFAMSCALPYVVLEACMSVFHPSYLDNYAVRGFDVMLTCVVMFAGMATLHEVVREWRIKALHGASVLKVIWSNIRWLPCITLLYGSVCFPMTTAAFCYFFGIKIVWGATVKETKDMSCWSAIKATWAMFSFQFIVLGCFAGAYGYCIARNHFGLYYGWGPIWYCGLHLAGPFVLNPYITSLSF